MLNRGAGSRMSMADIARCKENGRYRKGDMVRYVSHSYYMDVHEPDLILNETEYFSRFVSAIENQNIFGVQYHPEKSHEAGDIILSNFVNI
jgi:imidazoleglycerol phosphate synthase glutamine amidotransferase subunit HisH